MKNKPAIIRKLSIILLIISLLTPVYYSFSVWGGTDSDRDEVPDETDNCPYTSNPHQEDRDEDGVGDACDNCPRIRNPDQNDVDDDLYGDVCDNCPETPNPGQEDADGDGVGDVCEGSGAVNYTLTVSVSGLGSTNPTVGVHSYSDGTDVYVSATASSGWVLSYWVLDGVNVGYSDAWVVTMEEDFSIEAVFTEMTPEDADGDGVPDGEDNCVYVGNPGQLDSDGDGRGDECDNCVYTWNPGQEDADEDGVGDKCDSRGSDLVITDIWIEEELIWYQLRNIGNVSTIKGHDTALFIDEKFVVTDAVNISLDPGERYSNYFEYEWKCTSLADYVLIIVDYNDEITESSENNNQRQEYWKCDEKAPVIISGPILFEITHNSAVIHWVTNEESDSKVIFGNNAGQFPNENFVTALVQYHNIKLTELEPSSTIHFVVQSTDANNNTVESSDFVFETAPLSDNVVPLISLLDPGICEGAIDVIAEVSDNEGVERVEFFIDDELIFIDYSPPFELPLETIQYDNGEHNLNAIVYDYSGNFDIDDLDLNFDNTIDVRAPYVIITSPSNDGASVAGEVSVQVYLDDDVGLFHSHMIIDDLGWHAFENFPTLPKTKVVTFKWDTSGLDAGSFHTIKVEACDDANPPNWTTATRNVKVTAPLPPPTPPKLVISHEVTRHTNYFAVSLSVSNIGEETAYNVQIEDYLKDFQPISDFYTTPVHSKYDANYDAYTREWECRITSYEDIPSMSARTYTYFVVPVLSDSKTPTPEIGFQTRLHYDKDSNGLRIHEMVKSPALTVRSGGVWIPISKAFDEAVQEANYLIVTNPLRLFWYAPSGMNWEVNGVFSDMAKLARYRRGVVGFVETYDKHAFVNLIKPGGDWSKRLSLEFSHSLQGYLLIVGEREIFPVGYWSGFDMDWSDGTTTDKVWNTDIDYTFFSGNRVPERIVGRIIGNGPTNLRKALQTSIKNGDGSCVLDYSNALVVSGTGNYHGEFVDTVDNLEKKLTKYNVNVEKIHWKDYSDNDARLREFVKLAPDNDLIYLYDHGAPNSCGALDTSNIWGKASVTPPIQPTSFGSVNPIIFATSCLTGSYENHRKYNGGDYGIAEAFFDRDALVYIGSTEVSGAASNNVMGESLFSSIASSPGWNIGFTFSSLRRYYSQFDTAWEFWAYEYNLYGDPKSGKNIPPNPITMPISTSTQSTSNIKKSITFDSEVTNVNELIPVPSREISVPIPDFEVNTIENFDYVNIPDGELLLKENQPQIPIYSASIDYPAGYRVQDVVLTDRSGLITDTGFNIPTTIWHKTSNQVDYSGNYSNIKREEYSLWYPKDNYTWKIIENPDGTTTLLLVIYPFFYNPQTTDIKYYKNYNFDIKYKQSSVNITKLTIDKDEYKQGEEVTAKIELNKSNDTQDIIISAVIKESITEKKVDGFPLKTLRGLSGSASISLPFDSKNLEQNRYSIEVTVMDINNTVLDRQTELFEIGISSGNISSLTTNQKQFELGDIIDLSLTFNNDGTVKTSGTAIIKIQSNSGDYEKEFNHEFSQLTPYNSIEFNDEWSSLDADEGNYTVLGYVYYNGKTTDPAIISLSASSGDTSEPEVVCSLYLVVETLDSDPIPKAKIVTIEQPPGQTVIENSTNSDGWCTVTGLKPGYYEFSVTADGYVGIHGYYVELKPEECAKDVVERTIMMEEEPSDTPGGIPGYPFEALITAILAVIIIQRQKVILTGDQF